MIPQAYINEWQQIVPWKVKEQVEQDLLISRALVAIYSIFETIGTYDPHLNWEQGVNLKQDRAAHWLQVGAQPSDGVVPLLRNANLIDKNNKPIPVAQPTESAVAAA